MKVTLITPERTKLTEIVLQKLKMSPALLSNALLTIDDKVLTHNNLQSLANICPRAEEVELVVGFLAGGGSIDDLAQSERFINEIRSVNGFYARINALYFVKIHEEMFLDLEPKVSKIRRAVSFIKNSPILPDMLQYTLAVGNFLNGGDSLRGGAAGFKLDSLMKTSDVKMKDNKTTLMMYIIE